MANALWITLIGMGLVFAAILLLWGMMALLVWVTPEREEPEASTPAAEPGDLIQCKRRAAAAAAAVGLVLQNAERTKRNDRPGCGCQNASQLLEASPWQVVQRANQLSQKAYSSRKKVVR